MGRPRDMMKLSKQLSWCTDSDEIINMVKINTTSHISTKGRPRVKIKVSKQLSQQTASTEMTKSGATNQPGVENLCTAPQKNLFFRTHFFCTNFLDKHFLPLFFGANFFWTWIAPGPEGPLLLLGSQAPCT